MEKNPKGQYHLLIIICLNVDCMSHKIIYIFLAAAIVAGGFGGWYYWNNRELSETPASVAVLTDTNGKGMQDGPASDSSTRAATMADTITAIMKTNFGDITLELYRKDAPVTVENFIKLSQEGFYNTTRFHRVIKGFMIQGGDPNSKDDDWSNDGTGSPGYTFKDEINSHKIVRGVLAMANAGPATNGSQFFIVTAEATPWLDGKHTVFGRVTAGMDAVDKIEDVRTDKTKGDHPIENVTVNAVTITEQ